MFVCLDLLVATELASDNKDFQLIDDPRLAIDSHEQPSISFRNLLEREKVIGVEMYKMLDPGGQAGNH